MEKPKLRIISGIPASIIIEAGDSRREIEVLPGKKPEEKPKKERAIK